jgi:hypothetical protein
MTFTDHGITVTIKYGKGYDDTWAVFKGVDVGAVGRQITDYFGIDAGGLSDLSLHELVQNVTSIAHGTNTAATVLGAVAIPQTPPPAQEGNPWAGLDEDTKDTSYLSTESPFQHLFDAMNAATDVKELQKVWATNQAAFQNDDLMTAYKARGKELSK